MVIESRTIVGAAAAFALVGGALWGTTLMLDPPSHAGSVEVTQVSERSWTVEVKEMGAAPASADTKTAGITR